jgi:predicted PurR-regulated permease PerM
VVQPLIYGKSVKVNPLVTIVMLVGAELLGILGVLLAIPSAAAIQIILRDWWSTRKPQADDDEASITDASVPASAHGHFTGPRRRDQSGPATD